MTTRFDRETALTHVGDGVFEGRVDGGWRIVRGANGGHMAAIVLRAMMLFLEEPSRTMGDDSERTPRSLTVHFTRAPKDDATVRVAVATERVGRTMSTLTARMEQEDKVIAVGLASFSTARTGPEFAEISMPEVPSPDELEPVSDRPDFPFGRQFDFRRALGPRPGERSDTAEHGVWLRLREPQMPDYVVITQLCDAWAPAVFARLGEGGGGAGVPTVEMTYHFREMLPQEGAKADDWYLGVFKTTLARSGFIEEDGWLWSEGGKLLAQSRQLAILESR